MSAYAQQETIWLGDLPVATLQNGTLYNIYPDHLGTPRLITNAANSAIWKWEGEPFGSTPANEDPDGNGVKFSYNLRFPGQYHDAETGKHYNYFRDYDPGTGRYVESDPIGLKGGMNTYAYVGSNPVLRTDPKGKSWITPIIVIIYGSASVTVFKDCMERCTGITLPRTPASPTCSPDKYGSCAELCMQYAALLGFGADPILSTTQTIGGEAGE